MPPKYQKKDPISHCLERPDMYIGSTMLKTMDEYIAVTTTEHGLRIARRRIVSSPAILRVFIEILSNALDNVERSRKTKTPCTRIHVSINQETGESCVWNDGEVIPVEVHDEEGIYNHTLIFGHLLTGSNYNDEEERIVAGRNGIGAKACAIFSKRYIVEGCDPKNGKTLVQEWTENLRLTTGPIITPCPKTAKGYTKITWFPDFARFELPSGYTSDIVSQYYRYVIDAAMLSGVQVTFNGLDVPVRSLRDYGALYDCPTDEMVYIKTTTSEVLVTPTSGDFQPISFVNGIYTRLGGQHVDAWSEAIFRPFVDKFNGKKKTTTTEKKPEKKSEKKSTAATSKVPKLNIDDVRQFFRLFVVSTVIRPRFNGQDKEKLEAPVVEAEVKASHIQAISRWSVMEDIQNVIRTKELLGMKKAESKKRGFSKIDDYDPANNAGRKQAGQCSLILCEGLSAKTYVVAGIEKGVFGLKGRDWFGVLPLRGKLLNTRNATPTQIAGNKVITDIIQAIGLRHGEDYTKEEVFSTLNYGRLIILTDADTDGIHIEGLILNFLHSLFPSILERTTRFVFSMKTPIIRVFSAASAKSVQQCNRLFYDERRFREWMASSSKQSAGKVEIKYYKGLGTTSEKDVPDTFGLKMIEYVTDEEAALNLNKVFHKKHADDRKQWLASFDPDQTSTLCLDDIDQVAHMDISSFVDYEMIKFSHADCARSIPSGIDGLKESQRKILYAVRKRKLTFKGKSLKVAQLGGYTAEHSNYHHGEQNLHDTIIGMAQSFVGSNNIPLLYRDGMFGTRLSGGADAASARYICTKMDYLTDFIYRPEDDPLLTPVNDDGDLVQPEHYVPIVPMILINGCRGIGTGWSSYVPCYNPRDVIEAVRIWIESDGEILMEDPDTSTTVSMLPDYLPWYHGFHGTIQKSGDQRYITYGTVSTATAQGTVHVTELPVSMWTDDFKSFCEDLKQDKKLKDLKSYCTPQEVHFVLTPGPGGIACDRDSLKLYSYLYTSNMVMFNEKNQLRKYTQFEEIVDAFCHVRLEYYARRKQHAIRQLELELRFLTNKERFITEVVDGTLEIRNVDELALIATLEARQYDRKPSGGASSETEGGYEYLLRLHIRTLTTNKIIELQKEIQSLRAKLEQLQRTTEQDIWLSELQELENAYDAWTNGKVEGSDTQSSSSKQTGTSRKLPKKSGK